MMNSFRKSGSNPKGNGSQWLWRWEFNVTYDLYDNSLGYIMGGPPTWYLHPDNEAELWRIIDKYDGYT